MISKTYDNPQHIDRVHEENQKQVKEILTQLDKTNAHIIECRKKLEQSIEYQQAIKGLYGVK